MNNAATTGTAAVDLYWLPLGAGGHFVRLNGRAYEALGALMERRPACDLYHSALQVQGPDGTFVIEQTPVPDLSGQQRGVVAGDAVGSRWADRFRIFRYEIRLWRNGHVPDVAEAVDSPRRLSTEDRARRVLDLVWQVPTPVWGRDELGTGELWNSNSVIAWVVARSGIDTESIRAPAGGRAPPRPLNLRRPRGRGVLSGRWRWSRSSLSTSARHARRHVGVAVGVLRGEAYWWTMGSGMAGAGGPVCRREHDLRDRFSHKGVHRDAAGGDGRAGAGGARRPGAAVSARRG